jgi:hypothetical protein
LLASIIFSFPSKMNESDRWSKLKKDPPITLLPMPTTCVESQHIGRKGQMRAGRIKEIEPRSIKNHHYCWKKLLITSIARISHLRWNRFSQIHGTQNRFAERSNNNELQNSISNGILSSVVATDGYFNIERSYKKRSYQQRYRSHGITSEEYNSHFVYPFSSNSYSTCSTVKTVDKKSSRRRQTEYHDCLVEFAQLQIKQGKAKVIYLRTRSSNERNSREFDDY